MIRLLIKLLLIPWYQRIISVLINNYEPVSSSEVNFFLQAVDRLRSMDASCWVRDSALFSATVQNLERISVGESVPAAAAAAAVFEPIQPEGF